MGADLVMGKPYINTGAASGPLTPALGDLVATPKGYRSLALEGFSEDLDQDGFVDPIGQAVQVIHAPLVAAPALTYAAVKPVEVKPVEVKAVPDVTYNLAPAATVPVQHLVHTAPVVQHVGYNVHHQIHHAPVIGAFTGLVPASLGVSAVAAPVEEAPAV